MTDTPTDTDIIANARGSADAVRVIADRLHERSCTLNMVLYRLAVASGVAEVGAQRTGLIDTEELLQRVESLLRGGPCPTGATDSEATP